MDKLKVLFVLFTNIKTGAGTEKSLYYYLKYADTTKFDITVLHTNLMPGGQRLSDADLEIIKDKAKFIEIKDYRDLFGSIKNKYFYYIFNIFILPILFKILRLTKYRKILKKFSNYDVVYLFDNYYSSLFSRKSIVIGSNHCAFDNPNSFRQKLFAKLISLRLIFPSISAMHLFPQNVSLKGYFGNKPIILLSNGVDTNLYYPQNNKNLRTRILFVGRLEESKSISMVLKVYNSIKEMFPAELIIVGSGNLEAEVDNVCNSDSNVKHFKHLSENDLAMVNRSCDIFLYPTQGDTFALVVVEALSSGLKVVTTNILYNTYKDFIRYNVIEFVDFDEKLLIDALIDIKDKEIDKKAIHSYVERNYSWKTISQKLFNSIYNISTNNTKESESYTLNA